MLCCYISADDDIDGQVEDISDVDDKAHIPTVPASMKVKLDARNVRSSESSLPGPQEMAELCLSPQEKSLLLWNILRGHVWEQYIQHKASHTGYQSLNACELGCGFQNSSAGEPACKTAQKAGMSIDDHQEILSMPSGLERFRDAMQTFRMMEAGAILEQLEAQGVAVQHCLGTAEIARVRRTSSRCKQEVLKRRSSWRSSWPMRGENSGLDLHWAFKLQEGCVYAVMSTELESGIGIARAIAALCELHLYKCFNDDILCGSALEERRAANECIWRLVSHNKKLNIKTDNIWQVSVTDALDTEGIVIVDLCVPQDVAENLQHVDIPQPREGFTRISEGHAIYTLQPVVTGARGSQVPFKLFQRAFTRPASANYRLLSMMPAFVRSRVLKKGMEDTVSRLKHHIRHSPEINDVLKSSPRAPLYVALEKHLEQWVAVQNSSGR